MNEKELLDKILKAKDILDNHPVPTEDRELAFITEDDKLVILDKNAKIKAPG